MKCKRCDNENNNNRTTCWFCGAELPRTMAPTKLESAAPSQPFHLNWRSLGIFLGVIVLLALGAYVVSIKQKQDAEDENEQKQYLATLDKEKQQYQAKIDNEILEMEKKLELAENARREAERSANIANKKTAALETEKSKYNQETAPPSTTTNATPSDNQDIRDFIVRHFNVDNSCNVDSLMDFYADEGVYYDEKFYDKSGLMHIKQSACERLSKGPEYTIRSGSVKVSQTNYNHKTVQYVLDWKFFSPKQQKTITGATEVTIIIQTDLQSLKIVRENHRKLYSDA